MVIKGEDPYKRWLPAILLVAMLIIWAITAAYAKEAPAAEKIKYEAVQYQNQIAIVGGNTLLPIGSPINEPLRYFLGSLSEIQTGLMDKIMDCESGDDPTAQNPNSSAYGRCQMLKSTQDYCEKKWGLEIDWEDSEQQGYACERLLREEGTDHWKETEYCWAN